MSRRFSLFLSIACHLFLSLSVTRAWAEQRFPERPIRLILPVAPGGGGDFVARVAGQKLTESLGQQIVVDHRPGGGGVIASSIVARAAPDGYTLYLATPTFTSAPSLQKELPFDPFNDFTPISLVSVTPAVLVVHPSLPVKTVKELIAWARRHPRALIYGAAGIGSASHLAGEQLKMLANVDILHVGYKGSAQVSISLLSGDIALAIINPVSILPSIKAGKLRALAVTTTMKSPLFPELPTISESGVPGYESSIWTGLLAPRAIPTAIVSRLNSEIDKALRLPDVTQRLMTDGTIPSPSTAEQFSVFLKTEIEKTSQIVKRARIAPY